MARQPLTSRRTLRRPLLLALAACAVLLLLPGIARAQLGAGMNRSMRLEPTTRSTVAIAEFNSALLDIANIQPARATEHLRRALDADPELGIARAFFGFSAPGLTRDQRETEIERGVAAAAKASTPELIVATAVRARFRGDWVAARDLFRSASEMLPNDPNLAYQYALATGQVAADGYTASIVPLRAVIARFPDFAPPYNILAYDLFRTGDRVGAMDVMRSYVARATNEPNAHDSFGELLQWNGRLDDAIVEYRKALALDADYTVAGTGIAEAQTLAGRTDLARAALAEVMPHVTLPATRIAYRRQAASTFVIDGNERGAITELTAAMDEATRANLPNLVAGLHVDMAMINALVGDGKSVATHLAAAGTTINALDRSYYEALAYAIAKQPAAARTSLEALRAAIGTNETPANARFIPTVNALLLINDGKGADAVVEIGRTDLGTPVTRAVMALAQQAAGNIGTARALRDEILADRMLNLANGPQVSARRLVKRIN